MPNFQCSVCGASSLVRSNFKFSARGRCYCVKCWGVVYMSSVSNCKDEAEAKRLCPKPNKYHRIERHKDGAFCVVRLQDQPVQHGQVPYEP